MSKKTFLLGVVLLGALIGISSGEFGAYYCKLDSGQEWESAFRAGPYADVAVCFENPAMRFVFWRASSYLPHLAAGGQRWYVDQVISRSGDGNGAMPDKFCQYSKVRVIENSPARVVIQWRYAPDFGNVDHDGHADEYYTIYPDGICIRTIRRPAARLDDWLSAAKVTVQRLLLSQSGISSLPDVWDNAPAVLLEEASAEKYENEDFDEMKRCYILKCRANSTASNLNFTISTSGRKVIHNPAVVIKNWGDARAVVHVVEGQLRGYRTGYVRGAESTALVVWLEIESTSPLKVSITPRGGSSRTNKPPEVIAGADRSIVVSPDSSGPYPVALEGKVEDDGLGGDTLSITWSKVSGPGSAEFENAKAAKTNVSLSVEGTYQLRLTADDGSAGSGDDVIVVVRKEPGVTVSPVAWWKFDEAAGDTTTESISGVSDYIDGNKAVWAAGVLGTSLVFDGYPSMVTHPKAQAPAISDAFTLEAWVAIQAYPWNWCPIVHQSTWEDRGYWLGIDEEGRVSLKASIGGDWQSLNSSETVGLYRWVHVAGTFDSSDGRMRIYIDGSEKGSKSVSNNGVTMAGVDIKIGKGRAMPPTRPIREGFECSYSIDGAIDEVKIYDRALSPSQIAGAFNRNRPDAPAMNNPPAQKPTLPTGPGDADRFCAYYTKLKFHQGWDNMWRVSDDPDIVVQFDRGPYKYVFWRGTRYIPHLVSENNIWYNNQFNEARSSNGCAEPMSDNDCRHSYVRIIQSHDARAIIHWRYALENVVREMVFRDDRTGWNDWTDEYFYIYPDGVSVREINLWSTEPTSHHEWHEAIVLTAPGTWPIDNLEHKALYVAQMNGSSRGYSWYDPDNHEDIEDDRGNIYLTDLKSRYDPFAIVQPDGAGNDGAGGWGSGRPYPYYNHWPVAQIPSDGRYCLTNERTAHTSLTHIQWPFYELESNHGVKIMLTGMTDKTASELVPLAKSWSDPPPLNITSPGYAGGEYDKSQRAYRISKQSPNAGVLKFTLQGSSSSPIVNPCFIVQGWGGGQAGLIIDGQKIEPGGDFRQGIEASLDEVSSLVVWISRESTNAINVEISSSVRLPSDFNGDGVVNLLDFAVLVEDKVLNIN